MNSAKYVPGPEGEQASHQLQHKQAAEDQAEDGQHLDDAPPRSRVKAPLRRVAVARVVGNVQLHHEVGQDGRDVQRHQHDDKVVAPFGGQESLQALSEVVHGGRVAVQLADVAGHDVVVAVQRRQSVAV